MASTGIRNTADQHTPSRRDCLRLGAAATAVVVDAAAAPPSAPAAVDFRYTPLQWQTAYCFPDDPYKSLVDQQGSLLYGNPGRTGQDFFPTVVEFSLLGMEDNHITRQELEAPGVPIVHTRVERPEGSIELTTFATRREGEGRVDNVLLRTSARSVPLLVVRTRGALAVEGARVTLDGRPLLASSQPLRLHDLGNGWLLSLGLRQANGEVLLRFPQQGQTVEVPSGGALLEECRAYWKNWRPFAGGVDWRLPRPYGDFLKACARNIVQAREVRHGDLTFQVGPTCYRGLWVVDGKFILESARYLGYHAEARQGLRTTWTYQRPDGALDAGGGPEHYKDAAIAMFSTVRQCELSRDWTDFREFLPRIRKAAEFLQSRRDRSRDGLIVPGFADGGFTKGYELTNTVWTLAGLKAVASTAGGEEFEAFYKDLRAGFDQAAGREMTAHPSGFQYLPMVMREDPAWKKDEWDRPRPQTAQWALSQSIYPGVVFGREDPIVSGHVALMKACTKEDVPVETGWLPHGGLWTYNAPFVSHAALWAGDAAYARRTFHGFLNHASPLYCWREEQPLRGSLVAGYVGDMPHNWASAECVLYLRHMLVLEDGRRLRLLAGIEAEEMAWREPFHLSQSPTRFGSVNVSLEPAGAGWRFKFERGEGPAPAAVEVPATLGGLHFKGAEGAAAKTGAGVVSLDPAADRWSATWGA